MNNQCCKVRPEELAVSAFHGLKAPPLVYLATPYSYKHADPTFVEAVKELRFQACTRASGWLMNTYGWNVFSPITHSHPMHKFCPNIRGDWEFWKKVDLEYIALSNKIVVLCLPGWEKSTGVTAELTEARRLDIPVIYMRPAPAPRGYDMSFKPFHPEPMTYD
jgi:hypothetical protein